MATVAALIRISLHFGKGTLLQLVGSSAGVTGLWWPSALISMVLYSATQPFLLASDSRWRYSCLWDFLVCAAARASQVLLQIVSSRMCRCLSQMMTKSGLEVVTATSRGMVASGLSGSAGGLGGLHNMLWVAPSWLWRLYQRFSRTDSCLHVHLPSSSAVGQPDKMWAVVD